MWRPLFEGVLDLLGPPRCPGCDYVHAQRTPFCEACAPLLEPVLGASSQAHVVFHHQGPLADAIHRFKYAGRVDLTAALGRLLVSGLALRGPFDGVLPIPLHPGRLRRRGYNQSILLARPLARALGVPVHRGVLRRTRATRSQVGLDRVQRLENLNGAFSASARTRGGRWLVLDDVRTSGATLGEARRCLLAAGAKSVSLAALAQADEDGTNDR